MLKRILFSIILLTAIFPSFGQTFVQGSKFSDNWSVGIGGGMVTPMKHHAFWGDSRGLIDINIQKDLIPAFALGVNMQNSFNTSSWFGHKSSLMIDHSYLGVYSSVNLMNLFTTYPGQRRLFDIEFNAGTGWIHSYNKAKGTDANSWGNKIGANFNFNLGSSRAWTISFKPAILWNMGAKTLPQGGDLPGYSARYNANSAVVELIAGVTYHFGNSNGTHSFVNFQPYDSNEIDQLKNTIKSLTSNLENCSAEEVRLKTGINKLENEIDACVKRPKVVKEITDNLNNVRYIFFSLGSSLIEKNQQPNLELIAFALKNTPGSTVTIKGYASPEGSTALNRQLSSRRAEAVKSELVKKYNISPNRIITEGDGVGDIFNIASWNRVAVCTVNN